MAGYSKIYCIGGEGGFLGADGMNPIGVNLAIFFTFCNDKYKHVEETPKQKPLTGLEVLLEHTAINIPSLRD